MRVFPSNKFYCEEELKRINKILLTYQTEKYRAYSKATKGEEQ